MQKQRANPDYRMTELKTKKENYHKNLKPKRETKKDMKEKKDPKEQIIQKRGKMPGTKKLRLEWLENYKEQHELGIKEMLKSKSKRWD